jgi:hypothetical protein
MQGAPGGEYRVIVTDPATGRIKEIQTRALPAAGAPQSQAERLDKIEAELRTMMKEIASMRQTPPFAPAEPTLPPEPAR